MEKSIFCVLLLKALVTVVISKECLNNDKKCIRFLQNPETVVGIPGDSVYFECNTNVENGNIWWLFNRSKVISSHKYKISHGGKILSFKLKSKGGESQEVGQYQCVTEQRSSEDVTNNPHSHYFVASISGHLSLAYLKDFSNRRGNIIEAYEGNEVVIGCDVPKSNPPAFVQYYKNGLIVKSEDDVTIINENAIFISNASAERDSGNYSCEVSNHMTGERKKSPVPIQLVIKAYAKLGNVKSQLIYRIREHYDVRQGGNLTIPCVASGSPKPYYTWTRISDNSIVSNGSRLEITDANFDKAGKYQCTIIAGSRRFLRQTTVNVLTPPKIISRFKNFSSPMPGKSLLIDCVVIGYPETSVSWFFNGWPVSSVDNYEIGMGSAGMYVFPNNSLYISELTKSIHDGVYQCFAENAMGETMMRTDILVNSTTSEQRHLDDEDRYDWLERVPSFLDQIITVPPTKPNVTQTDRFSAMLEWTFRSHYAQSFDLMPVSFFKIQFKEIDSSKKSSEWNTMDDVLDQNTRKFEVRGLKDGLQYRFRVVVVYINSDNRHGESSRRFKLDKLVTNRRETSQKLVRPQIVPVITEILPLRKGSLRVGWSMNNSTSSNIEGYFIYIKEASLNNTAEKRKITIIGHTSHSYIIEGLRSGKEYYVEMEAFNFAGTSPISKPKLQTTMADDAEYKVTRPKKKNATIKSAPEEGKSNITTHLILGVVLAASVVAMIILCSFLGWRRRSHVQKTLASINANKIGPPSTNLTGNSAAGSSVFHMKEFDRSNIELIEHERKASESTLTYVSSAGKMDEYTLEPTCQSWKRRRKLALDH